MSEAPTSTDAAAHLAAINRELDRQIAIRSSALGDLVNLDAEWTALGHHPNYPAYVAGGMLADKKFGASHILSVIGLHMLDWRDALDQLGTAPCDPADGPSCLLVRMRSICAADPTLGAAGFAWCHEAGLLKRGAIDRFWIKRPTFGLGQAAKTFGLEPHHADGHRGIYAVPLPVLRRGFENASVNQSDQRFGALLRPVIEAGGERLARIGAAALHRDAEARYNADCERFAAHQRAHPDRRWRWKPALSRQGHLAVTTAQAKRIDLPTGHNRGHAANWLGDHDANLRFNDKEA